MTRVVMVTSDVEIDRRILQEIHSLQDIGLHVILIAGSSNQDESKFEIVNGIRIERFVATPETFVDKTVSKLIGSLSSLLRHRRSKRVHASHLYVETLSDSTGRVAPLEKLLLSVLPRFDGLSFHERSLVKRILFYRPDVIHVHDLPQLRAGVKASKRTRAPLIYDAHELYPAIGTLRFSARLRLSRLESRYSKRCNHVITVNPYIASEMSRRYKIPSPTVILNAHNYKESFKEKPNQIRLSLGLSAEIRLVLFQGWMSKERGLDLLLEAFKFVDESIHLVLLGYGNTDQLRELSMRKGLHERVHFLPRVAQQELLTWTASADCGVIPYPATDLNHMYCSPNKLFEFIQARIPIVANDLPYLRDVVEGFSLGSTAAVENSVCFGKAIEETLSTNSHDKQRLSASLDTAAKQFNWSVESEKLLSIYRAFLSL